LIDYNINCIAHSLQLKR